MQHSDRQQRHPDRGRGAADAADRLAGPQQCEVPLPQQPAGPALAWLTLVRGDVCHGPLPLPIS